MSGAPYHGTRRSHGRSTHTRSPISSSSSSPESYNDSRPHPYDIYNGNTYNRDMVHDERLPSIRKRRVAPSPPLNRRFTPSPPPYSKRIAPSPPSSFSDYPSSSIRLKTSLPGEYSPPRVKQRIAPPPPESFLNPVRNSLPNDLDYRGPYNESHNSNRYENDRNNADFNDRLRPDRSEIMQHKGRGEYSHVDHYGYHEKSDDRFVRDQFGSKQEMHPYHKNEHVSSSYGHSRYNQFERSNDREDYKDHYHEPKVRKPPPAPFIPATTKSNKSQSGSKNEAHSSQPVSKNAIQDSSQVQNEEGECISNDEEEDGELISYEERLKRKNYKEQVEETLGNGKAFDPSSTASLDEQEQHDANSKAVISTKNCYSPSSEIGDIPEVVPKKPPLPMHIQKNPLKGSFISSSILTRDENNMYSEVKKTEIGVDESVNCSTIINEIDEDVENISGDNEEDDSFELEQEEEDKTENKSTTDENSLSIDFIKQSPHLMLDSKFLSHLAEMHPVSALNELSHKMNWPTPNFSIAFECGPPMSKMYIFKVLINGQSFQPTIAVDNKKDAKQNVAWYALQEMGFVKSDPANPL